MRGVKVNAQVQRVCVWCGPLMAVVFAIGFFGFAGFVPPPSPNQDAEQIAQLYRDNLNGIRAGMVIACLGSGLLAPYLTVVSIHLHRIGGAARVLAWLQLLLAPLLILEFVLPMVIIEATTFRPDRSPEVTQALNDLAWIMFVGIVTTILVEWLAISVAVLQDGRAHPVFPRWAGYLSLWAALSFTSGTVLVFFKTGPFAWNGLIAFWLPVIMFFIWMAGFTPLLFKAISQQEAEESVVGQGADDDDLRARVDALYAEFHGRGPVAHAPLAQTAT